MNSHGLRRQAKSKGGGLVKIFFFSLAAIVVIFQIGFNIYVFDIHRSLERPSQQAVLSPADFRKQMGGYVEVFGDRWDGRNKSLVLAREKKLEAELRAEIVKDRSMWKGDSRYVVIILGWKRYASLQRLLESLVVADYSGERVDLHVHIDGGSGEDWERSIETALRFKWGHGKKKCLVRESNEGLMRAWLSAWDPIDDLQRAIILEDDIVVSPVWFRWTMLMFKHYGRLPDIAGVSLQRQQLRATDGGAFTIQNNAQPFGYKLVGSWGFAPHPAQWREFIRLDWRGTDPFVPGLVTSDWFRQVKKNSMWTQLFIHFCQRKTLYTIYLTAPPGPDGKPRGFAANFREAGEHYATAQGMDVEPVQAWDPAWEAAGALERYGFDCQRVTWCHGLPSWAGIREACLALRRAAAWVGVVRP